MVCRNTYNAQHQHGVDKVNPNLGWGKQGENKMRYILILLVLVILLVSLPIY